MISLIASPRIRWNVSNLLRSRAATTAQLQPTVSRTADEFLVTGDPRYGRGKNEKSLRNPADRDHYIDGLRKAGLPE